MHNASNEPVKIIFAWIVKEDDVWPFVDDLLDGVLEENGDVDHHFGQFIIHFHLLLADLEDQAEQEVSTDRGIDIIRIQGHCFYAFDPLIECQNPSCRQDEFRLNIILGGIMF